MGFSYGRSTKWAISGGASFGGGSFGGPFGLSPLMYLYVNDSYAEHNNGCLIVPGGDPLCGGASTDPGQTVDPGMSSGRWLSRAGLAPRR